VVGYKDLWLVHWNVLLVPEGGTGSQEYLAVGQEKVEDVHRHFMCLISEKAVADPLYRLEDDEGQEKEKIEYGR